MYNILESSIDLNREETKDKIKIIDAFQTVINQIGYMVDKFIIENQQSDRIDKDEIEATRKQLVEKLDMLMLEKLNAFDRGENIVNYRYIYVLKATDKLSMVLKLFLCNLRLTTEAINVFNKMIK
jgi:hypothetical protein